MHVAVPFHSQLTDGSLLLPAFDQTELLYGFCDAFNGKHKRSKKKFTYNIENLRDPKYEGFTISRELKTEQKVATKSH